MFTGLKPGANETREISARDSHPHPTAQKLAPGKISVVVRSRAES